MKSPVTIFWFRRDLRLHDNRGLREAMRSGYPVLPVFIFDTGILSHLDDPKDRRVDFIHQALAAMNEQLKSRSSGLITIHGTVENAFRYLSRDYSIRAVYCNRDYEPQAIERDTQVMAWCREAGIPFRAFKDQAIFDKKEIVKSDGTPYTIYSPYARKWRETMSVSDFAPVADPGSNYLHFEPAPFPTLEQIGFEKTKMYFAPPVPDLSVVKNYDKQRNFPAKQGTTRLGVHLRFGTLSVRQCVRFAVEHNDTWLSELIWREFFMQILYHFPEVVHQNFKRKWDRIVWRNDEAEFRQWCQGKTGYPIVDAGMRELSATGFMHNRVRMIVASFLCKHLLIDWRWGEAWFASKLDDYELASNNGNWQWAAGTGCDAAPYFRVFNPTLQAKKFDPECTYIRQWVPEYETDAYPKPMLDHEFARQRALQVYGKAAQSGY